MKLNFYPPKHYRVVDNVLVGRKLGAKFELLYGSFAPGGYAETHTHDFGQAFFILKGEINIIVNGRKNVAGPNIGIYIPPGEEHSLIKRRERNSRTPRVLTCGQVGAKATVNAFLCEKSM